jgi:hypothetical protein
MDKLNAMYAKDKKLWLEGVFSHEKVHTTEDNIKAMKTGQHEGPAYKRESIMIQQKIESGYGDEQKRTDSENSGDIPCLFLPGHVLFCAENNRSRYKRHL